MRTNRLTALALAVTVTLAVAACGGSSSSGSSSSSSSSSSKSASSSSSSKSSASSSSDSSSLDASDLQGHLLVAADLGGGLQDDTFNPPDPNQPLPCAAAGEKGPDATYPPETLVGSQIDTADFQAQLKEELRIYADEATASSVTTALAQGFGCSTGALVDSESSSQDVQISNITDVTSELTGADEAAEWQLSTTTYDIVEIIARQGNVIVAFQFVAVSGADTSKLPSPLAIAKAAVEKLAS